MLALEAIIAAAAARPKRWRVTTLYASGATRTHDVHSPEQAANWARGEKRKIGRNLIDRATGETVRVVGVNIASIAGLEGSKPCT